MNNALINIFRFVLLIAIQIFICTNIHLFGFLTPAVYLLALLLLPLELPRSVQYLIGFFAGLLVDMFTTHTLGVNAAACTVMMFVRPYLAKALNGRNTTEGADRPIPGFKDFKWIILYVSILTIIHQVMVIMLETFTFKNFGHTALVMLGDILFTTFLIICIEYIFIPANKKK